MKTVLLLVLLSATQTFATSGPGEYTRIDDSAKVLYVEAIQTAVAGKNLVLCSNGQNYSLSSSVAGLGTARELFMNRNAQPVFIFRFQTTATDYYDYMFTTSADRKSVVKFAYKTYKMMRVNKGDLLDPVFADDLVMVDEAVCEVR